MINGYLPIGFCWTVVIPDPWGGTMVTMTSISCVASHLAPTWQRHHSVCARERHATLKLCESISKRIIPLPQDSQVCMEMLHVVGFAFGCFVFGSKIVDFAPNTVPYKTFPILADLPGKSKICRPVTSSHDRVTNLSTCNQSKWLWIL
jgi:hypothetical protein